MTTYRHRVRYHEADAQGFLFNGRYLEIADVAMTEFFRAHGYPYRDLVASGVDPSVVSARLSFRAPAHFDEELEAHVTCTRVGTSSFTLVTRVTRDSTVLTDMELVYVNVDPATGSARPLTGDVATALRAAVPAQHAAPTPS
ncbi:thioesterase family protein [Streptomyces sp. NPDC000151]|uniref:acyl-CoA thioesterase n=1 Tax=Streptomyces sp. NPDC000151 TaxID=3154244 RepID=UPI003316EC4C